MGEKEDLARKYSFNIPSEIYNTLETDADRLLWKSETETAFEAGWDSAKQVIIEYLKTILSIRSDVHPFVREHFIKLVERAIEK